MESTMSHRASRSRWAILSLLIAIFVLNQADRQLLPVLISGGLKCSADDNDNAASSTTLPTTSTARPTTTFTSTTTSKKKHHGIKDFDDCISFSSTLEGLLKGPTFATMFGVCGVLLGFLGDRPYRNKVLALATLFWSLTTAATYFVDTYWELFALRLMLGVGEAVFNPIAYAVIASLFKGTERGTALSVYHVGVYVGGGTGYIAGALQESVGWRMTFVIFGAPGVLLALVYLLAVPDSLTPVRDQSVTNTDPDDQKPLLPRDKDAPAPTLFSVFKDKERLGLFLLLCAAAAIRQIAGYSLGAYYPTYYRDQYGLDNNKEYGRTMLILGMIVIVTGTAGSVLGGVVTKYFSNSSVAAKLYIIGITQLLCAPILVGLFLNTDLNSAYALQGAIYITGETWLGLAACSLQDLMVPELRAQASALYIMLNTIIGGCGPLLIGALLEVPTFKNASVPIAKCLLYVIPTCYVLSFILFAITGAFSRRLKHQYMNE